MLELLSHRVEQLERAQKDQELRVRVLEIAHARLVAYAAGGAFVGGAVFQIIQLIFR